MGGTEEWRQVGWAPEYAVSEFGRIMRLVTTPGTRACKVLKPYVTEKGYSRCVLRIGGASITVRIHRLVCEAFHGPAPEGCTVVRHLDGDPQNNRASNLAWGTPAENTADMYRHGRAVEPPGAAERRSQTHCVHGHEFTPENTYVHAGKRHCRACGREKSRRWRRAA